MNPNENKGLNMSAKTYRYEAVAKALETRIADGEWAPGGRLPAETRLADEYKVNRLTLRKAVDLLDYRGVVRRMPSRGAVVLDRTDRGVEEVLFIGDFNQHFYHELYLALVAEAQRQHVQVVTLNPAVEEDDRRSRLRIAQLCEPISRLICCSYCWKLVEPCLRQGRHTAVIFGLNPVAQPSLPVQQVILDQFRAGVLAATELIRLGHRELGYVGFGCMQDDGSVRKTAGNDSFYAGFHYAAGKVPEVSVKDALVGKQSTFERRKQLGTILGEWERLPTGFGCLEDFRAADLYAVCSALKCRPGEDIAIIGCGNTPWCRMLEPALTSVDSMCDVLAKTATALALQPPPQDGSCLFVDPRLQGRASTRDRANPWEMLERRGKLANRYAR